MKLFKHIESELNKYTEIKYQKFSSSLIPGVNNILGIRIPNLRKIAKNIASGDWQKFLCDYKEEYMEETMLKGLVITLLEEDLNFMLDVISNFIPKINNWAVCDTFSMGLKCFAKNKKETFDFLMPYLNSDKEYEMRFGVVMLLAHFIDAQYIDRVLKILYTLNPKKYCDYYYVKMAIAWAISVCYVKFPDKTFEYIENNTLDNFTHNKSISKIIESYRVSKEDKARLKLLKRKN